MKIKEYFLLKKNNSAPFFPYDTINYCSQSKNIFYFLEFLETDYRPNDLQNHLLKGMEETDDIGFLTSFLCIDKETTEHQIYLGSDREYLDYIYAHSPFEEQETLPLCKQNKFSFLTMTKDNFIKILTIWDTILKNRPPLILFYQNESNIFHWKIFNLEKEALNFIENSST